MNSFAGSRTLLDFALRQTGRARLAMRGTSMLPLLHEPFVLEIGRPKRKVRVGDIVLFDWDQRLVAHRVVQVRDSEVVCAGDAHPDCLEHITEGDVIGVVTGVNATPERASKRIDGPGFALRGRLYAYSRRLRAFALDALPMVRPRAYASLVAMTEAIVRDDRDALLRVLQSVDRRRVRFLAERHRIAPILSARLSRVNDGDARAFASTLHRSRWLAAARTAALRKQLKNVLEVLNAAGVQPVLLKGGARLWCGDPEAELHESVDLDILVDRTELSSARDALVRVGYRERAIETGKFYDRHHHARPLFPPISGVSVELHHALARMDEISTDTSFAALQRFVEDVSQDGVRAQRLNRVGTALHLIVHGYRRCHLRDLYLLARLFRAMSPEELCDLGSALDREQKERVRMQAMAFSAASLAGISRTNERIVHRFAKWAEQREDLPGPLRRRAGCYEAWLLRSGWRGLFRASKIDYIDDRPLRAARSSARRLVMLAAGAAIAAYVPLMRRFEPDPAHRTGR